MRVVVRRTFEGRIAARQIAALVDRTQVVDRMQAGRMQAGRKQEERRIPADRKVAAAVRTLAEQSLASAWVVVAVRRS